MQQFEVVHRGRVSDEAFSNYTYEIRLAGRRVAEFQHNFRGEEHMLRVGAFGAWEPFENILEGGGPQPLRVSAYGATQLRRRLAQND